MTGTFKTVGPSDDDAKYGRIISGLDTPKYDADMSYWECFDVEPPLNRSPSGEIYLDQPRPLRTRWWNNPRVFFNSGYKCAAGSPVVSGEINI